MIAPGLLEILCCPETHQPLLLADAQLVAALNAGIASGQLENRAGQSVRQPAEAALIREDRQYLYLIRDGIPVMLIDEAIALSSIPK